MLGVFTITSLLFCNFLNGEIIDKAYVFAKYSEDNNTNKEMVSKFSIEKTLDIDDDSFTFFNFVAKSWYDYDSNKNNASLTIREAYYDSYYLRELVNLRVGRSIKTFDYTKTYSILNFLSTSNGVNDRDDRELKTKPLDGASITFNALNLQGSGKSAFISAHIYATNTSTDGVKEQRYLFEATQSGDKYYQSIFVFNDYNHIPMFGLAKSQTLSDSLILTMTVKYMDTNKTIFVEKLNSLMGLEYSFNTDFLVGVEKLYLGDNIDSNKQREEEHTKHRSKEEREEFYSDLTSKRYLFTYLNYSLNDDMEVSGVWLKNLDDYSNRYTMSATYSFDSVELVTSATIFDGNDGTEFGYLKNNAYSNEWTFFMSYLF